MQLFLGQGLGVDPLLDVLALALDHGGQLGFGFGPPLGCAVLVLNWLGTPYFDEVLLELLGVGEHVLGLVRGPALLLGLRVDLFGESAVVLGGVALDGLLGLELLSFRHFCLRFIITKLKRQGAARRAARSPSSRCSCGFRTRVCPPGLCRPKPGSASELTFCAVSLRPVHSWPISLLRSGKVNSKIISRLTWVFRAQDGSAVVAEEHERGKRPLQTHAVLVDQSLLLLPFALCLPLSMRF